MPEHCEVIGVMRDRVGSDGQHYAVKYHIRLPSDWNGRLLFQGGGGTNGMLGNATGPGQPGMPTALEMRYAVVSTDTGHDNAVNSNPAMQGTVAFGHDYEARVEYAEKAINSVASVAKAYFEHILRSLCRTQLLRGMLEWRARRDGFRAALSGTIRRHSCSCAGVCRAESRRRQSFGYASVQRARRSHEAREQQWLAGYCQNLFTGRFEDCCRYD